MSRFEPGPGERRQHSHGQGEDAPILEGLFARWRRARSLRYLRSRPSRREPLRGLDLGCGYRGAFVTLANRVPGVEFRGGDLEVAPGRSELFPIDLGDLAEVELSGAFDVITMHAVLEHLSDPEGALQWVGQHLAPGGVLLATAPSWKAKPVLEFLAFRLGLVSAREIRDHKRYFDQPSLAELVAGARAGLRLVEHRYFQLGFNNWVVVEKPA